MLASKAPHTCLECRSNCTRGAPPFKKTLGEIAFGRTTAGGLRSRSSGSLAAQLTAMVRMASPIGSSAGFLVCVVNCTSSASSSCSR